MSTRQLNLGDFAEHCLEEIQSIQDSDTVIELLSSGKVVAVLSPPPQPEMPGDLADWVGSGVGTMAYGPGYDPEAPTFMDADDAQDFWNDLSAEQCAALQRVPITRRAEDFFGEGTAEEWEGFEETLEQWRSETIPSGEQSHAA